MILGTSNKNKVLNASLRIIIPMWVTFILFIIALFVIFVPSLNKHMMNQKKEVVQELAVSTWRLLFDYEQRVRKGEITLDDAQSRAINRIRNIRYGLNGKDYFCIFDMHPRMIMHPYFPNLEGNDLTDFADPKGKLIFIDSLNIVREKKAGYIDYIWQWNDDPDRIVEKLSYVKGFAPWGWVIATGIYIEDVNRETDRIFKSLTSLFTGLLFFVLSLSFYISWQAVKTERKRIRAEDDLRESEKRYRLLADNATDNIWILNLTTLKFDYVSPSVERLFGYTPGEKQRLEFKDYMPEEAIDEVTQVISEELEKEGEEGVDPERSRTLQIENIKKDGTKIWVELTARFLRNENGEVDQILGITRDITQRKRLEQQLTQSHKMEALGTLAGGIAHDFNNILSSVIGFTELVKMSTMGDEETQDNLEEVLSASIRARELVQHIKAFSRQAEVQKDSIILAPLIKECVKFIRASIPTNIEIKQNIKDADIVVTADPSQIHQVIMHLCTNAAHSMRNNGGILDIQLESVDIYDREILDLKSLQKGRYLKLTIADTGCGIPVDILDRIFDPFFTTKERGEGTGLGLATVHGIIKNMGGTLSVYSEVNKGTTFEVFFPVDEIPPEDAVEKSVLKKGSGKILFVDDEKKNVSSSKQILESLGYDVVGTSSSEEALELFKNDPETFDIIITDLLMPNMTGLELSKMIFSIRPGIPLVLCTGFSERITSASVKENGIFDMIMKPIIASELSEIVNLALKDNKEE